MTLVFEDLDDFFSTKEHAQTVLIGPAGQETSIKAIFESDYHKVEEVYSGISSVLPTLICKTEDVASVSQKTRVVIAGIAYRVVDKRPDGTGITEMPLNRV